MDTLLSDFKLTATRLAELLVMPDSDYSGRLAEWFSADQRSFERYSFYRVAYKAIEDLHRRRCDVMELRGRVQELRFEAQSSESREQLVHNARAIEQYLDHHAERQVTVFDRISVEAVVSRVRVYASPQLFVQSDGMPTLIWLDCTESFNRSFLLAKCNVTLWLSRLMGRPMEQVEAIHAAEGRMVATGVLPSNFDRDATAKCQAVNRIWTDLFRSNDVGARPSRR